MAKKRKRPHWVEDAPVVVVVKRPKKPRQPTR